MPKNSVKDNNYVPSEKILDNYAKVLVNCAINAGKGIKKGDIVLLQVPESAKPLLFSLRKQVLVSGGNPITQFLPDGEGRRSFARDYYNYASNEQLSFFPKRFMKGRLEEIDSSISILSETNKYELKGIDPKKIMLVQKSFKEYMNWAEEKENKGKYFWTLALYPTKEMAKDVGMTLKEYWNEVIKACYLNNKNPVKKWKNIFSEIDKTKNKLNKLKIKKLHIVSGKETDLWVELGEKRKWLGGSGRNIPSFEVFISPDARYTNGKISFNKSLYRYGNKISGIKLEFKNGKVVKASAKTNEKLLKEMISVKGADRIGEFSLTDSRMSKITKFMGNTLYDENVGGKYGNTHIALGKAYKDSYNGNPSKVTKKEWKKLGFNESAVHTDIISTEKRIVAAILLNGKEKLIYKNGKFLI